MTSTLHEAIAAARAGDMARAQMLAADVVSQTPDDPNGWYLLSQLVESDARRAAYLSKTLALAPDHPRARAEFAALPPALVTDLSLVAAPEPAMPEPDATEIGVAEAVVEPVEWLEPPAATPVEWLAPPSATAEVPPARPDDVLPTPEEMIADFLGATPPVVPPLPPDEGRAEAERPAVAPDVPEWLQPLSPEPAAPSVAPLPAREGRGEGAPPTAAPAPVRPAPRPAAQRPAPARRPNTANRALSVLLGLLALLTLAVLAFLLYLLLF